MKVREKLPYVEQAILSVTRHDDADSIVRLAAVEHIEAFLKAEKEAITARALESIVIEKPQG